MALKLLCRYHIPISYLLGTGANRMLTLITRSDDVFTFISCFGQIIVPIGLIDLIHLSQSFFLWMSQTLKSFKFPNFLAPRPRIRIARVVETEIHPFLRKRIIILSPVAHIKLGIAECVQSHHFRSLAFQSFTASHLPLSVSLPLISLHGW
jgi:hypothetical protein